MLTQTNLTSATVGIFIALGLTMPATAQESSDDDRIREIIIVTAEKREEDILKVPVTMTAFNQDMLEELGMTSDEDLEQLVPGLQFAYDSEGNGITIQEYAFDWGWLTEPRQIGVQVRFRPQF